MIAMIERPSANYNERPAGVGIEMLVLHYTGMVSCEDALARLCDEQAKVSAHYLIDEDGRLYRLVAEDRRAWHAGVAYWRGERNINACSIGIEMVNPGHEFGYREFGEAQMLTLIDLCQDILARYVIPPGHVLGHSDVAPQRKKDPGELFDWQRLAVDGIGLWPQSSGPVELEEGAASQLLHSIGYDTSDLPATLMAFQRRYRPEQIDGLLDPETGGLIRALSRASEKPPA